MWVSGGIPVRSSVLDVSFFLSASSGFSKALKTELDLIQLPEGNAF
jgi:hypothetical protein